MPSQLLHGRYRTEQVIGTGTYGQVVKCFDTQHNKYVAVKIAHREAAYRRSALNEVHVLKLLAGCEAAIDVIDSFEEEGRIHIVQDMLCKNMYEYLRDLKFEPLPLEVVRRVGQVVLEALAALHGVGYIHCDIKPENVMQCHAGDLINFRLIDFGAVRRFEENQYYDVQSLWYRAPEVICGVPYTPAIDAWSVGCLLYELHTGNPLFAGNDAQDQLNLITEMFGKPSEIAMNLGKYSQALNFASPSERKNPRFEDAVMGPDPQLCEKFCDLLRGLLRPDESNRMTVGEALLHPFFSAPTPWGYPQGPGVFRMASIHSPGGLTDSSTYSLGSERQRSYLEGDEGYDNNFNDSILNGPCSSTNVSPSKWAIPQSQCMPGPKPIDAEWVL